MLQMIDETRTLDKFRSVDVSPEMIVVRNWKSTGVIQQRFTKDPKVETTVR